MAPQVASGTYYVASVAWKWGRDRHTTFGSMLLFLTYYLVLSQQQIHDEGLPIISHTYYYTFWIKRIEGMKWYRGRNGLHQLEQPIAPSILFPVLNPHYPQGKVDKALLTV